MRAGISGNRLTIPWTSSSRGMRSRISHSLETGASDGAGTASEQHRTRGQAQGRERQPLYRRPAQADSRQDGINMPNRRKPGLTSTRSADLESAANCAHPGSQPSPPTPARLRQSAGRARPRQPLGSQPRPKFARCHEIEREHGNTGQDAFDKSGSDGARLRPRSTMHTVQQCGCRHRRDRNLFIRREYPVQIELSAFHGDDAGWDRLAAGKGGRSRSGTR
jgi:hypothetical protein